MHRFFTLLDFARRNCGQFVESPRMHASHSRFRIIAVDDIQREIILECGQETVIIPFWQCITAISHTDQHGCVAIAGGLSADGIPSLEVHLSEKHRRILGESRMVPTQSPIADLLVRAGIAHLCSVVMEDGGRTEGISTSS
jgi:hypothetical protein